MAKYALLIGVSNYEGLNNLPGAQKDIEEMQRILQNPDIGNFDEVILLHNPSDPTVMQVAIQTLFSDREKDDLLLLYFSGHGIIDNKEKLYLATCKTHKNLFEATTVPASFVHGIINKSKSKRQVVILDCCYSGAFAKDWSFKSSNSVDIEAQLGGEGRVVLTSCTAFESSIEQEGAGVYTTYLIEGIRTGAADTDNDGIISIDELHEYAKKKVHEAAPAMKPEIYAVKEGYKIKLAKAPLGDPKLKYRKEVETLVYEDNGEISPLSRSILNVLRANLDLLLEETSVIEHEVLKPYREKQNKLQKYREVLFVIISYEYPLSKLNRNRLNRLQQSLQLRDEDIAPILEEFRENIEINPFFIVVIGEFKRGKSTLINALLGQEIIPSDILPCSAALTRITDSLSSYVEVEFKDGRKEKVDIEKLNEYVTKLKPEFEATAVTVKEAVIYYPINFCQNNVHIIDTPGINDIYNMDIGIFSVLPKVDAVVFTIMAQSPFSVYEQDLLGNIILKNDIINIIFVVTGIDSLNSSDDADRIIIIVKERIKKYVLERVAQQYGKKSKEYEVCLQKFRELKFFGLSAYQALEAKINKDDDLLTKSRFTEFEAALEKLIINKRETTFLQEAINGSISPLR